MLGAVDMTTVGNVVRPMSDEQIVAHRDGDFPYRQDRRWLLKLGLVLLSSIAAVGLIVFGAARFLDQAQDQRDQVECIRREIRAQAQGSALMGQVVLNPQNDQATRQAAFVTWAGEQGRIADRIAAC